MVERSGNVEGHAAWAMARVARRAGGYVVIGFSDGRHAIVARRAARWRSLECAARMARITRRSAMCAGEWKARAEVIECLFRNGRARCRAGHCDGE